MPDYSKGKIYKILNNVDNEIYVGSTCELLSQRMAKHRDARKSKPQCKLYKHMNELGVENFYIELIENYPCNDVYELRAREGYYIREIGTLNMKVAGRNPREYWDTHKDKYNEEKRKYRLDNKDEYNEQRRSRYQENKEISKAYYNKNKERIKQQHSERIQCSICGCHINKGNISTHQKTKKCKSYVKPDECNNLIKMD